MNLGDLLKTCRREISDDIGVGDTDYLVKEWQLIDYANDAETEACRRSRLLVDSSTAAICQIPIVVGTNIYAYDPRIIFIRRISLASKSDPLGKATYKEMDEYRSGWMTKTGTVEAIVTGMDTGKIRTFRIPTDPDTLNLTAVRTPLNPMAKSTDSPEINARYHRSLVFWMKHKVYENQDTEIYDPKLSAKNLALFEQEFGPKVPAGSEVFDEMNLPYNNFDGSR